MEKYFIHFSIATLVALGSFAGINWLVDPYWIFSGPEIKRLNIVKPELNSMQSIFKIGRVNEMEPEILILGTSREDTGIDVNHEILRDKSAFNAAIPASPYREARLILNMLVNKGAAPKIVVLGLSFEGSNALGKLRTDFSERNFNALHRLSTVIDLSTLISSLRTVQANLLRKNMTPQELEKWKLERLGTFNASFYRDGRGHKNAFQLAAKNSFKRLNCATGYSDYKLIDEKSGYAPINEIRELLEIIYRSDIQGKIFISPSHARHWETYVSNGLWTEFEEWKRLLVRMNEEEALISGKNVIPLWDFSGYNSVTTEAVPPAGDTKTRMKYYFEASHYSIATGDMILDRIFSFHSPFRTVPDDFGVRLSSINIESHLSHIRAERLKYESTHPTDLAEILALKALVLNKKNCTR